MRTRTFVVVGVLVALLIASVVSFYASSMPDGLESVADEHGFAETAQDHPNADGPLADYSVKGVDDARLSGGLAGVLGSLVVLGLVGGLTYVVRRGRRDESADPGTSHADGERETSDAERQA